MANQFQNLSFEALFNAASDAMLLTDTSGQVVQANPAARLLLGYSEEKIIGLEVEALMPQRYRDHHRLHREIFNTKPEKRSMGSGAEFTVLTDDGKEMRQFDRVDFCKAHTLAGCAAGQAPPATLHTRLCR